MNEVPEFRYNGARALTILHEQEVLRFVETWKRTKAAGVNLPPVKNPDYQDLEGLLHHVLFRARDNMIWMCDNLKLKNVVIDDIPEAGNLENQLDQCLPVLLAQLRTRLKDVSGRDFYYKTYTSRWKTDYCIDAMMEHLVMHAMRHTLQLEQLQA